MTQVRVRPQNHGHRQSGEKTGAPARQVSDEVTHRTGERRDLVVESLERTGEADPVTGGVGTSQGTGMKKKRENSVPE